jgi:hypothetical protein
VIKDFYLRQLNLIEICMSVSVLNVTQSNSTSTSRNRVVAITVNYLIDSNIMILDGMSPTENYQPNPIYRM